MVLLRGAENVCLCVTVITLKGLGKLKKKFCTQNLSRICYWAKSLKLFQNDGSFEYLKIPSRWFQLVLTLISDVSLSLITFLIFDRNVSIVPNVRALIIAYTD